MVGSLRKAAFSGRLARSLSALAPSDLRVELLPSVGLLPLYDQDILDEEVPQAVTELAGLISKSDAFAIVSPEYNWSIPGVLKNALDWLSRLKPQPLEDKPVILLTCSPGLLGGARAHAPIRNVLHALDTRILARPEVQISGVAQKLEGDSISDPATADFVTARLKAFNEFIRR
ncbi:hypothetical protein ATO6_20085 [Oceanicola sp. 22II-s10i]|nr:hypothetical protein ATO6_20085 [Oceanicola sp. 22II-s10i]